MNNSNNPIVNELWQDSLPNIYSKLLRDVAKKCKLANLLESAKTSFTLMKISEWADIVINLTEGNFNTFAFTNLHFKLACILYDYMSSDMFNKK